MLREIAVFVDESGQTTRMGEYGRVIVYHRECGVWHISREEEFAGAHTALPQIRERIKKLLAFFGDCKVFVAKSVLGVYYYELEKAGISVWEFSGLPDEFLDYIIKQEEADDNKPNIEKAAVPVPQEVADGRYYISIKDIQENNTSVTSKQVLQPFLARGKFYCLEILCSHLPPWLENELLTKRFESEIIKIDNKTVKVVIMPACCS